MSHPFGDLLGQYLHRKHGLSQSKLAAGILQAPAIITDMCKGRRLTGPQARERVLMIIEWLQHQGVLGQLDEANVLLNAAGMAALHQSVTVEAMLIARLSSTSEPTHSAPGTHLSSLAPRLSPRHNLPTQLTPLIGCAEAIAELTHRLRTTRLLTLIGPPGVGKTRLATHVANALLEYFADGAFFTPLAPVHDPAIAPTAVCQTLGLQESGLSAVERLKLYLHDKHLLLILDNFEHLLMPPPLSGERVSWIADLLAACPQLHILVTSRAPLRLRAERQFPVSPLALPDLAQPVDSAAIANVAAVALFVERAQAVQPAFTITPQNATDVAALCVRLDGLPLAIELVAARVKLLPPAQLLARLNRHLLLSSDGLRDSAPRQQTLRAAISWSYDLLTTAEQRLFARLGLFVGGFTLEAAEAVCGDLGSIIDDLRDGESTDQFVNRQSEIANVLDGLASLLDKSLIEQKADQEGAVRFGMLELMHEYALEWLELSGELSDLRRRHAEYFLRLAEEADSHLRSTEQLDWFKQLEAEHDNLRAILAWSVAEDGDPVLGLQLVNALSWFWFVRCYYNEGSRWIDRLLAVAGENIPLHLRAWTFSQACLLAVGLDDFARGRVMGEAALALARDLGDQRLIAYVTPALSNHLSCQGELHLALQLITEALEQVRNTVDKQWMTGSLLYTLICFHDDPEEIARLVAKALPLAYQVGDRWLLGYMLALAGRSAAHSGDLARAAALYKESLLVARQLQDNRVILFGFQGLGELAYAQDSMEQAAEYYHHGFEVARQTGTPGFIAHFLREQGRLAHQRGDVTEALTCYKQALLWVQKLGHNMFVASCLLAIAILAEAQGAHVEATCLLGTAEALYDIDILVIKRGVEDPDARRVIDTAHARLTTPGFAAAWAEGQAMTLDEAIAYALAC